MSKKIAIISAFISTSLFSSDIFYENIVNKNNCSKVLDKNIFKVCYDYKNNGAKAVYYKLDGKLVHHINIEKRPRFYSEKNLPAKNKIKYADYKYTGYDRGHLAPDANFDYDIKALRKTYSMANIVPQTPSLNRYVWLKAEKYERQIAVKLKNIEVLNIVNYSNKKLGNSNMNIPKRFYKIIYNNKYNFKRCFSFENKKYNVDADKLKYHVVDCDKALNRI